MINRHEFLLRARLDDATLTAWITEEWIIPRSSAAEPQFAEVDVARVELIRDLKHSLDVNDAGVGVILRLVDQVHGLRQTLAEVLRDRRERGGSTSA